MLPEAAIPSRGIHTEPFWAGARAGKLMLPHCLECNRVHWYPRHICPFCHATALDWVEASGEGTIHTYAVQHLVPPAWQDKAPYVTAYVDLKEGDRMLTILLGVDPMKPESIRIGAPVRVEFHPAPGAEGEEAGMHVPYWRVVED